MRLRLHGTRAEIDTVLTALAKALEIQSIGRAYPDRPPSTLIRVYLDIPIKQRGEAHR